MSGRIFALDADDNPFGEPMRFGSMSVEMTPEHAETSAEPGEDGLCAWCCWGGRTHWPERCPPHDGERHLFQHVLRDRGKHLNWELVTDRPLTNEERAAWDSADAPIVLEEFVRWLIEIGVAAVWMRRVR